MTKYDKNDLKEKALKILTEAFGFVAEEDSYYKDDNVINDDLISEIFNCAWNNQFSDDASRFKKNIRKIIRRAAGADDEN